MRLCCGCGEPPCSRSRDMARSVVIRYCRTGDLVGVSSLFGTPTGEPVETRAVVHSRVIRLRPSTVVAAASSYARIAVVLLAEQSRYAQALAQAVPEAVSGSVPQRVVGLRSDGVVSTDREGIVVLDTVKLAAASGTQVPDRRLR